MAPHLVRFLLIIASLALSTRLTADPTPPTATTKLEFSPEQSAGGLLVPFADGTKGVALDKSLNVDGKTDVAIVWKPDQPLAAGWWHGMLEFGPKEGDDRGWVNYHLGIVLLSDQKPMVNVMSNFHPSDKPPYRFEFWTYCAAPASAVRIQGVYDDLWKYKRSWPIKRLTMSREEPPAGGADVPMTLDLPVQANGAVSLPQGLPAGVWSLRADMTKDGVMTCAGEDGREVKAPFSFDRWRRPLQICFFMASPLRHMNFKTPAALKGVVLEHIVVPAPKDPPIPGTLIAALDPARSQTARLELIGAALTGEPPAWPSFPNGKKMAVVTTWDDGAPPDLRCAELLAKLGYHPSFFMNQNSLAMRFLDKLEALGAEVGSHTLHHPSLHALPPEQAIEECVGMRKLLEKQLGHPVVSMAYPNGYTPAYDAEGDYALRAVRAAGHWSGRTTLTASESVDSIAEPLAFKTDGFFGDAKGLERDWEAVKGKEGAIFHFWGHSWQIGKTDEQWQSFEALAAKFAGRPDAWYPTQGDLFYWIWLRKNVAMAVQEKSPEKVVVQVKRPWVHPYLAKRCAMSLRVPAGVTRVIWDGKDAPIVEGRVDLAWAPE